MAQRDRDESGRPRSARPRDALGRPLPRGSTGVPRIPEDLRLPPAQTLVYAQQLLDQGLAFNAHEVLEAAWKNEPAQDRDLWQGLAQLAVGITHIQRGNLSGAAALLGSASSRLVSAPEGHGVDIDGLVRFADALRDDVAAGAEIPPERLRPALLRRTRRLNGPVLGLLGVTAPTRWTLADGRDLLFFALPGHTPQPVPDRRPLPARDPSPSQLRYDRTTGQWVVIAAGRQDRTYKPPAEACPLCPGPSGLTSEVPAADYDVVVFENRFPSLAGVGAAPDPADGAAPGYGRCEVICFSADHTGSFAGLPPAHARLVVQAWRHRTAELMALPGIEQVFCFENRGEDVGVTLAHPHGQIYGYPYLTPRTAVMLDQAREHRNRHGGNLFADLLAREQAEGSRIVARDELFTAFVPFAARWPVEVHLYPNRLVRNLCELTDAELDGFATRYQDLLARFDRLYSNPLPYMAALHQYTDTQPDGYFHVELMSIRRSATKLKYLAASESAMDAFIADVTPEDVAARLRAL